MFRFLTRNTFLRFFVGVAAFHIVCALISPFNALVHNYLHWFCHQRPDRCFELGGYYVGVCARCIGIYFGIVVGFLLLRWRSHFARLVVCASALLASVSIALWLAAIEVPNLTRSGFGACLGIFMIVVISEFSRWFTELLANSLLHIERTVNTKRKLHRTLLRTAFCESVKPSTCRRSTN